MSAKKEQIVLHVDNSDFHYLPNIDHILASDLTKESKQNLVTYVNIIIALLTQKAQDPRNSNPELFKILLEYLAKPELINALATLDHLVYQDLHARLINLKRLLFAKAGYLFKEFDQAIDVLSTLDEAHNFAYTQSKKSGDEKLEIEHITSVLKKRHPLLFQQDDFDPTKPDFQLAITIAMNTWNYASAFPEPDRVGTSEFPYVFLQELNIRIATLISRINGIINSSPDRKLTTQEKDDIYYIAMVLKFSLYSLGDAISEEQKIIINSLFELDIIDQIFSERNDVLTAEPAEEKKTIDDLLTEAKQILIDIECPISLHHLITLARTAHIYAPKITDSRIKRKKDIPLKFLDFQMAIRSLASDLEQILENNTLNEQLNYALHLICQAQNQAVKEKTDIDFTYYNQPKKNAKNII